MHQKNPYIMLTLLLSVFMMMLVASLFHIPSSGGHTGLESNLLQNMEKMHTYTTTIPIQYNTLITIPGEPLQQE